MRKRTNGFSLMPSTERPTGRRKALAAGAKLFRGREFVDERGCSWETLDTARLFQGNPSRMTVAQENLIYTRKVGTLRGLHYQAVPFAQAKLVSVVQGAAQFFWVDVVSHTIPAPVHSVVLEPGAESLWTPEHCAHGFLALSDETIFALKVSRSVNLRARGDLSFFANDIKVNFVRRPNLKLLSERDAAAPCFSDRKPFLPFC